MGVTMDDSIKRWTAKRKTALVVEMIQGNDGGGGLCCTNLLMSEVTLSPDGLIPRLQ